MAAVQKLTTTSYAVLGLLAIKPWTTYELARQISAGGNYWLRSRSKLFEEPKKLVGLGLAVGAPGRTGKRPKTVYAITEAGRGALAAWLSEPGETPVFESEQMLKVFFAEHGTKADLVAQVNGLREWAEAELVRNAMFARRYLAGLGEFPERTPILTLIGRFNCDQADAVRRWSEWAAAQIAEWPDDLTAAPPDRSLMERLAHPDSR
ncbi:PadR family transcriptional regulator [Dactylosporangium sp. NPDC051541]|uniref:PadR family transcriptional regulator n=1 Tax=Dactylosporangium sp. NPDC051541 TaxID=3363977 RepID=UPI003791CD4F